MFLAFLSARAGACRSVARFFSSTFLNYAVLRTFNNDRGCASAAAPLCARAETERRRSRCAPREERV